MLRPLLPHSMALRSLGWVSRSARSPPTTGVRTDGRGEGWTSAPCRQQIPWLPRCHEGARHPKSSHRLKKCSLFHSSAIISWRLQGCTFPLESRLPFVLLCILSYCRYLVYVGVLVSVVIHEQSTFLGAPLPFVWPLSRLVQYNIVIPLLSSL